MAGIEGMEGRAVALLVVVVDISERGLGRESGVGVGGWSLRIEATVKLGAASVYLVRLGSGELGTEGAAWSGAGVWSAILLGEGRVVC